MIISRSRRSHLLPIPVRQNPYAPAVLLPSAALGVMTAELLEEPSSLGALLHSVNPGLRNPNIECNSQLRPRVSNPRSRQWKQKKVILGFPNNYSSGVINGLQFEKRQDRWLPRINYVLAIRVL